MPKAATAPSLSDLQAKKDKIEKLTGDIETARSKFEASITAKTKQLERLQSEYVKALQGELRRFGAAAPAAAARPAATPASKRPRARGSIDADAIIAVVRANPGIGARGIAEKAGITATPNALSVRLRRMVDAGALKKSGERRQTTYRVK